MFIFCETVFTVVRLTADRTAESIISVSVCFETKAYVHVFQRSLKPFKTVG